MLLWIGQIAAEVWAGLYVWRLDMVPTRLFIYGVVVLALLWIFEGLLFFYGNGLEKKSRKGSVCRFSAFALIALTVLACIYAVFAADKVRETVNRVTEGQTVTRTYAVSGSDSPSLIRSRTLRTTILAIPPLTTNRTRRPHPACCASRSAIAS